jgi:hypothetical protein
VRHGRDGIRRRVQSIAATSQQTVY